MFQTFALCAEGETCNNNDPVPMSKNCTRILSQVKALKDVDIYQFGDEKCFRSGDENGWCFTDKVFLIRIIVS